jgi:uncharacterized membrane protein
VSIGGGSAGRDNDTGRIEAFSDAVFAIAITLLIIEIGVPHLEDEPPGATTAGRRHLPRRGRAR